MKGVKELKARIGSIGNIRKVTSTMELVAAAKMRKLQERALASRPYAEAIHAMMGRVAKHVAPDVSPLLAVPEHVERECVVVVAADKGLCGAFNANLFRAAMAYVKEQQAAGVQVEIFPLGKRVEKLAKRAKLEVVGRHEGKLDQIAHRSVASIMQGLAQDVIDGRFQRVSVVYTWLKSAVTFVPQVKVLLPFVRPDVEEAGPSAVSSEVEYIMEPSPEFIMTRLIPKSLEMTLYSAVLESLASEFASRRIAMKNATDSASDMIDELTMEYNKARQAGITSELLEITAGAEALKAG